MVLAGDRSECCVMTKHLLTLIRFIQSWIEFFYVRELMCEPPLKDLLLLGWYKKFNNFNFSNVLLELL